jgi:CRP/FNR family transcriptional regulator, cyclic AMP receptor protein
MMRVLHENHEISEIFAAYLLSRNFQHKASLVGRLFDLGEKPLARLLLLLAQFGKDSRFEPALPGVSQDGLAQMFGTTRSRIGHYMN